MRERQVLGRATSDGSQRYLQDLVNDNCGYLNHLIIQNSPSLVEHARGETRWVSPLVKENYKEYRDDKFLWPISQARLYKKLREFWPRGGLQWDALAVLTGKTGGKGVILAEAKANIQELGNPSYGCRASGKSRESIERALATVKRALGVKPEADWMGNYYQYANRLAHLYFLHVLCGVPTWMVYIYFVSAKKAITPRTAEEWSESLSQIQTALGLPQNHLLAQRIVSVFPEVDK